jgi:hypothetical protein
MQFLHLQTLYQNSGESYYYMIANSQSARPGHILDDTISPRQRLEYFERHIQNKSQNEYAQALYKTIEAEKSIRHFAMVFNDR